MELFVKTIRMLARLVLLSFAALFGLLAALGAFGPLTHKTQNAKSLLVLADMRDRVHAVQDFERQNGRLPNEEELAMLSDALPVRYHRYQYYLAARDVSNDPEFPKNWPATGRWVLAFWRGEWNEYYSSWDDRYTLSEQLTAWDSYGVSLSLAVGFFLLSRLRILRSLSRRERTKGTTDSSGVRPLGI